ncbi:MAG: SufD family Fe-S cluster assembly protein [Bacteriovoracaceae bacterium]|nr:SufD family Fe-S cluster assembly protein [Bacteriovoracaceae bacterium]
MRMMFQELPEYLFELKNKVVFFNGDYSPEMSDLKLQDLEIKQSRTDAINLLHFNQESQIHEMAVSVVVRSGCKAIINEIHFSIDHHSEHHSLTQILVENGAKLTHHQVIAPYQGKKNHKAHVEVFEQGQYQSVLLDMGGNDIRVEETIELKGPHANNQIDGLIRLKNQERSEHIIQVNHLAPETTSQQKYKTMVDNESRAHFTGKIYIAKVAQKSDSALMNKNLLLAKKSHVLSLPQLEIFADDVKCSHGSTTGQLNQEELFYLEARGIPKQQAQEMLLSGYSSEIINKITDADLLKILTPLSRTHL